MVKEAPLTQCDKCGRIVPADQIKKNNPLYEIKIFVVGVIVGGFLRLLFEWIQHLGLV